MIFTDDFDCVFVAGLAKFELIKFHLFLKTSKVSARTACFVAFKDLLRSPPFYYCDFEMKMNDLYSSMYHFS